MESSIGDEREDVQKKTFAKWINSQLVKNDKPPVEDLFLDLRDGEVLLSLLEILTAQQYKRERGRMRVHHINNVNTALAVLRDNNVKLVNISSNDIVDGNPKLTLGLVWSVILHWQVHYHLKELMSELRQTNLEKTLLAWCRSQTRDYAGVDVADLTTSWRDGLALNALLHRWRPQLFDYAALLRRSPAARLEHAFELAQRHLGIDRLLDPEDVDTPQPDKKSIMMYLMCLFQSLPHSADELAAEAPPARPLSTATTGSAELGGYGAALEEVLAWLLEAEERLAEHAPPDAEDLAALKEHFHSHERFLLELSEAQTRVGGVLEEGGRLVNEGGLSREEAAEVRLQVRLLNRRWEELRVAAMERQSAVHAALMRGQRRHLDEFRRWLTATEDRMSRMGGGEEPRTRRHLAARLQAVRALHSDLRDQQPLVDALADCVVVVDDEDAHHDTVTEIEDQLRALGERWSHTCHWTLEQLRRLEAQQAAYDAFDAQYAELSSACDALEAELKRMEANPVGEVGGVLERVSAVQSARRDLAERRRAATALDAPADAAERLEALLDRLDALHLILDVQASRIKEMGFELDTSTEETTAPPTAAETTESVTTTQTSEGGANKRPRLDDDRESGSDYQVSYAAFESWLQNAESTLETCQRNMEESGEGREGRAEVPLVVERLEGQLELQRQDFAHVHEIWRRLAADPALERDAERHERSTRELHARWERVQATILQLRNTVNLLRDKDNFRSGVDALRGELRELHDWCERTQRDKPGGNLLLHLRNRARTLKRLEAKLKEVSAQAIVLLAKPIPKAHKDDVEAEAKLIKEEFERVASRLAAREAEVRAATADERERSREEDGSARLSSELERIEALVMAEHGSAAPLELMERRREKLENLQTEIEALRTKTQASDSPRASRERLTLDTGRGDPRGRLADLETILRQRLEKLRSACARVTQLEEDRRAVDAWVCRADELSRSLVALPLGDAHQLEVALDASNKIEEEASECRNKLERAESARDALLEDCEEAYAKSLQAEASELRARFEATAARARSLNEELRRALERTEALFRSIEDTERWLQGIERRLPREEECGIADSAALYRMKVRFQTLKEECDERTQRFRDLNEAGNDALLGAEPPPAALAKRLTQLNARWTDVTDGVYERHRVLAEAWLESGELRASLAQEAAWLDGLQRRLRRSPDAPADAEEIADELYDLESYVRNRAGDRLERIRVVAQQLADAHIMAAWLRGEVRAADARWAALRSQAEARVALLERAARDAARSEVSVERVQRWADAATASRGAPAPEELAQQRAVVREVRAQADAYDASGKREAAARLREQLDLLARKLDALEARAESTGAEESLHGRLARADAALREVQDGAVGALAPTSADPEQVRAQLRQCLRLYRTLGELKAEVEALIKSGRRAVEQRAVDAPQETTRRIDALKELYNRLGAQITEGKARLEGALLAARELHGELAALAAWLDGLRAPLARQPLELEMSRMQAVRDKLEASYARFAAESGCEPARLAPVRARIDALHARWERLERAPVEALPVKDRDESLEYEKVTDTIKRRLDSPVDEPHRPVELKRSRIPLALRSPVPIKKEIQESGSGSRASSVERSVDARSIETPATPESAKKNSSTFNLLKDSDLFTQISKNKAEPATSDACHMVEVKEHEIVKSTVSAAEPVEIYPSEAVETVVQLIPQTVETVEILDDTESESICESDGDEKCPERSQSVEERKVARVTVDVPDLIPCGDGSANTPPPTPMEGDFPFHDLRRDEVNEYLILDEVPKDRAALPEPSATESAQAPADEDEVIYSEVEDTPQSSSSEFREKPPLSTSTPIKREEGAKQQVQVVAMSPKLSADRGVSSSPVDAERTKQTTAESALAKRFGGAADAAVLQFAEQTALVLRRMDVMLLTVGGVGSERDPGKRLEILKNQLGAIAPDAAALISRGDSLVYEQHKRNPALADYVRTRYQDRLRNKWAMVMSEVESRRNLAIKAEDDIEELNELAAGVLRWCAEVGGRIDAGETENLKEELLDRESDAERIQELSAALRAQRVDFAERAAMDAAAALERARKSYDAAVTRDRRGKAEAAAEARGAEFAARVARVRAAVAAARGALLAAPLAGRDYDEFPLQEDALAKVKSAIAEVEGRVEECEREYARLAKRGAGERARRARDKLRSDWTALREAYAARHARWTACAAEWARLYAALERCGEWLDEWERGAAAAAAEMEERAREVESALSVGRRVVGACGAPLARDVADQLEALAERWESARSALGRDELLRAPHNVSDESSLSVRLNLVKAREEEIQSRLQRGGGDELAKTARELAEQRATLADELAALGAFNARLQALLAFCNSTREQVDVTARDALAAALERREQEKAEVLESYKKMERSCSAAEQTVAASVASDVSRLREQWAFLRRHSRDASDTSDASPDSQASEWSSRRSTRQSPAAVIAQFDTTVQQIRDWVSAETATEMLRAQPVAVGDVADILHQLDKQKGVLRELEQKKPQLDELLHTAESLKGTENRQQLHGKGNFPH